MSEVMEAEVLEAEVEAVPSSTGMEVAVRRGDRSQVAGLIRPVAKPAEVLEAQEETRALVEQALVAGRDFDTIQGTRKPSLLKPGAERINAAFGVTAEYEVMEREVDHDRPVDYVKRSWAWHPTERGKKVWEEEHGSSLGLYRYVIRCSLVHRESGVVIGQGVGSCSSMEAKYISAPRDTENTILKMAKKRAYVDATLTTFGLSDQFTQDVEDLAGRHHDSAGPFTMDDTVGFGKHKGKTWAKLLADERDYVEWAVDNMDKLTDEARTVLRTALAGGTAKAAFQVMLTDMAVTHEALEAFAQLHQRLPDNPQDWADADYVLAKATVEKRGPEVFRLALQAKDEAAAAAQAAAEGATGTPEPSADGDGQSNLALAV